MADRPRQSEPYLFVSYASVDHDRVLAVVDAVRQAGVAVWLDQHDIEGGANYAFEITEAIEHCAVFVLMCSAASLASRNVRQEIALAWKFARPYLPLLLEAVTIPKEVAYWLEAAQWIEVLEKPHAEWLPAVLTALAPFGITGSEAEAAPLLVGREREQRVLREGFAAARDGHGSLVLIGGEAGIGKTTLAEVLTSEAEARGAFVIVGRCFDLAETPPYGPWIEAFRRYEPSADLPAPPAAFAQRGTVGTVSSQSALFEQIHNFFVTLTASRSAVVLLDDYHWADAASLDLLRFVARDCAALPLLVLVTYRSDELTRRHPLYALLPALVRESSATRLDLRHLDDDAVRTLIIQRYGLTETEAARLTAYLQERAEGNGLFLAELLRTLEEQAILRETEDGWQLSDLRQVSIPALLRQVIDGRVARLGEEAQRLLAVAAIIGHEVPLDVWGAVGAADEDALLDVVEQGIEARLLVEAPGDDQVKFAHALIREALYEGIPGVRRRRVHRHVGEVLAEMRDPDPDAVAYHFQRAGDRRAIDWLIKAGERAHRAYAWLTAADRYEASLALMEATGVAQADRGWLLYRLFMLRRFADPARCIAVADEAARLARESGDDVLAAHALMYRGHLRCFTGRFDEGLPLMEAGVAAVEALPPADEIQQPALNRIEKNTNRGTYIYLLAVSGRIREARRTGESYVANAGSFVPTNVTGARYASAYSGLIIAHAMFGNVAAARTDSLRSLDEFRALDAHFFVGATMNFLLNYVLLVYEADNTIECDRVAREGEEAWEKARDVHNLPPRYVRIDLLVVQGAWDEAYALATEVSARVVNVPHSTAVCRALAFIVHARGETGAAWSLIQTWLPEGVHTAPGDRHYPNMLTMQRLAARLSIEAGDIASARRWLEAHDHALDWSGTIVGQSEGQALWAEYHRRAGETEKAHEHAERALAHATEPRQPLALIAAHRLLGELDTEAGRFDSARTHLDASLALADACAAPYERALTLLAMAALHIATNQREMARTLLDEVRAICTPLGARPALARVDALAAQLSP